MNDGGLKIDLRAARKIHTVKWIIFTRWFYPVGVLLIGFLTKKIGHSNISFSYATMVFLFVTYFIVNFILWLTIKKVGKKYSSFILNILCYALIAGELIFFTIIMHLAGGVESVSNIFFFLPIVTASLLFGAYGSIITALAAGLIINLLVLVEYYNILPHISRFQELTINFTNLSIGLTQTITNAIFFLIVGSFAGYGARMLWRREESFEEKVQELEKQTRKMKTQELALANSNAKLDKKIQELESFQRLAVDRELKMVELKEEIKKLTVEKTN